MLTTPKVRCRLHFLPILTPICILGTFFITYCMSVTKGHVEIVFPFISYTAIHDPARSIFGQFVNIGALLLGANVYIRYLQMSKVLHLLSASKGFRRVNQASLWVGLISAFCFTMVANFQILEMRYVHYTGAGLAFILGLAYLWLQTSMTIRYNRWSCVAVAQLVISIATSIFLVIFICSKVIYKVQKHRGVGTKYDVLRGVYLTATTSEWLVAISIMVFVWTFVKDFSKLQLKPPSVRFSDPELALREYPQETQPEREVRRPIFIGNKTQASTV